MPERRYLHTSVPFGALPTSLGIPGRSRDGVPIFDSYGRAAAKGSSLSEASRARPGEARRLKTLGHSSACARCSQSRLQPVGRRTA